MESTKLSPLAEQIYPAFKESLDNTGQNGIYVINNDEYTELIGLSGDDARDLPDGLFLIDETVRDMLADRGVTYDNLNRGILRAIGPVEERTTPRFKRNSSAHKVVFGTVELDTDGQPLTAEMAIKLHVERGLYSEKPFKEIGNLAVLQCLEQRGVYKPFGILQANGYKFVMSLFTEGVDTLDKYDWTKSKDRNLRSLQENEQHMIRDQALLRKTFELLGTIHGAGVFHGDAQAKNLGFTTTRGEEVEEIYTYDDTLSDLKMTILDLENAVHFPAEDGNFSPEYYDNLPKLAAKDINQLLISIPKKSRIPKGANKMTRDDLTDFIAGKYIDPYINALTRSWEKSINKEKIDPQVVDELRTKILELVYSRSLITKHS